MSIYASIPGLGDHGDHEEIGLPWIYRGSHIPPTDDGPRGGIIGLALIPSHITADGRDDQPEDGAPWPWLRIHLDVPGDDPAVLISPTQARHLAEQLLGWAVSTEPPTEAAETESCPHCLGAPPIPRTRMPDHIAQHHPHHAQEDPS